MRNADFPSPFWREGSLEETLLRLTLNNVPAPPRKVLFWGDGVGGISSYVAGWIASKGIDVILLDGANRFDPYVASSISRRALIPPERLLKRIRIARAFTCYQMATLMGERLPELIEQEKGGLPDLYPSPSRRGRVRVGVDQEDLDPLHRRPWVILLGPVTTFLDEDVPEREVRPLFERSLGKVEGMAMRGIPFFLFQPNSPNPPFVKGGKGGLKDSKRSYLATRLFEFSNLVWRMSLDDQGPKMILEKGINKIADCRIIS